MAEEAIREKGEFKAVGRGMPVFWGSPGEGGWYTRVSCSPRREGSNWILRFRWPVLPCAKGELSEFCFFHGVASAAEDRDAGWQEGRSVAPEGSCAVRMGSRVPRRAGGGAVSKSPERPDPWDHLPGYVS